MRFILGVLVGYSMRGKNKLLITVLATGAFIVYIILPAVALVALRLDVEQARQSRPAQTRVPALKGLSYEDAEIKLHASNLNIRLLATRYDLPLQPGLIIDQLHNLERRLITVTLLALSLLKRTPMALVRNGKILTTAQGPAMEFLTK
ncbi:MAG TPA: hypothetical protein VN643_05865 [Pyrinomonadaceae bacterium]|nr:hypothetical protein [Pyrinomonadaceae bacterium]